MWWQSENKNKFVFKFFTTQTIRMNWLTPGSIVLLFFFSLLNDDCFCCLFFQSKIIFSAGNKLTKEGRSPSPIRLKVLKVLIFYTINTLNDFNIHFDVDWSFVESVCCTEISTWRFHKQHTLWPPVHDKQQSLVLCLYKAHDWHPQN